MPERGWLEQGGVVGENVVPLARNFGGGMEVDVEADHLIKVEPHLELVVRLYPP